MKSWKAPTPEEVSKAVLILSRAANYRHFFGKLDNPHWIKPLWNMGFFKKPPKVEYDDAGVPIFPSWPESRFLARMAQHAPDDVADVLAGILHTDNLEVREDTARAILAMPAHLAARFVDAAKTWVTAKFLGDFLAMTLGKLVAGLSDGGEADAALELASELLRVVPPLNKGKDKLPPFDFPPEPVARFGTWEYEQILERSVPHLLDAAGVDAIILLCDLLEEALRIKERPKEKKVDLSYIWRPAIEDHEQNLRNTALDALISALRDSVERLSIKDPAAIPVLVELLEKREWPLFQRISLFLLSRHVSAGPRLVEARVANEKLFDNNLVSHEYYHLCRAGFSLLSSEAKEEILGWIKKGLERDTVAEWIRSGRREPTDQLIDEVIDGWRLDRLTPIKDQLIGEWPEYYINLVNKMGEPRHPDFASWSESKTGPNSPLTPLQISSMPIEQILTFLRTWEPPLEGLVEHSVDGLGRGLTRVVTLHPKGFAALADEFVGLDPTYIRSLLSGLEKALRNGRQFDWRRVLALSRWVVRQPVRIPGRQAIHWEKDPDWGWTRDQIADLLSEGFVSGENSIPFEHRDNTWKVLEPLTSDPYPMVESESKREDAWRQPSMDSWNTTRGKAMHAVIRYGIWVWENVEKQGLLEETKGRALAIMPEVKSVLEDHLDVNRDPNPITRSVYGQWLLSLLWLDKEWVSSKLQIIFPSHEAQDHLWKAAWYGYVTLCEVRRPVLRLLRNQYRRAIKSAARNADNYFRSDPDSRLAEHLIAVYWNGIETLASEDSLIRTFFEEAPSKVREHALYVIGRWLNDHPLELPQDIAKRLTDLWQWRQEVIGRSNNPNDFTREVAQFGFWFVSGKFDPQWAFEQLLFAIRFSGELESEYQVVECLAVTAGQNPFATAECLEALVEKVKKPWRVYSWREQAFEALRIIIQSADAAAAQKAKKVANRFGEMGFRDFKVLVRPL